MLAVIRRTSQLPKAPVNRRTSPRKVSHEFYFALCSPLTLWHDTLTPFVVKKDASARQSVTKRIALEWQLLSRVNLLSDKWRTSETTRSWSCHVRRYLLSQPPKLQGLLVPRLACSPLLMSLQSVARLHRIDNATSVAAPPSFFCFF